MIHNLGHLHFRQFRQDQPENQAENILAGFSHHLDKNLRVQLAALYHNLLFKLNRSFN